MCFRWYGSRRDAKSLLNGKPTQVQVNQMDEDLNYAMALCESRIRFGLQGSLDAAPAPKPGAATDMSYLQEDVEIAGSMLSDIRSSRDGKNVPKGQP